MAVPEIILFRIGGPMISASGDASERKYRLLRGKSGKRWVVAVQEEAAENIYVDGGRGSEGMAGRTLTFELEGGGSVDFIGPWKTEAQSLLADTGFDVRGMYYFQCIIATERKCGTTFHSPDEYSGILHYDPAPILNNPISPESIGEVAQAHANRLGVPVYYAWTTKGGGCSSRQMPAVGSK
jgi:hypothetical protein